ncbi:hypothetical protein JCM5296_000534 [Sporobolomyces johnsonii]
MLTSQLASNALIDQITKCRAKMNGYAYFFAPDFCDPPEHNNDHVASVEYKCKTLCATEEKGQLKITDTPAFEGLGQLEPAEVLQVFALWCTCNRCPFGERMQLVPKIEEYPSWNGEPTKLLTYLREMDIFVRVNHLPENLLLAKFRARLTGDAQRYYQMRVLEDDAPCSWDACEEAFKDCFLGTTWQRQQQERYCSLRYRGQEPLGWFEDFVESLRTIHPDATASNVLEALISRVPSQMAMNLRSQCKGSSQLTLSKLMQEFEEIAATQFPHGFHGSNKSSVSFEATTSTRTDSRRSTSANVANAPRTGSSSFTPRPARLPTPPSSNRKCFNCDSPAHVANNCPHPPRRSRPAIQALADGDADGDSSEAETGGEAPYESSSDLDEDNGDVEPVGSGCIHALSSFAPSLFDPLLPASDSETTISWPVTAYDISGCWDDDFYDAPAHVLTVDVPMLPSLNDASDNSALVLSVGNDVSDPANELAEAGAPVLLSASQALRVGTTVHTTDSPMRLKGVNSGRMFSTALSLSTRVLINGQVIPIFLDTGAGPTVTDATALDRIDSGWRTRLKPMPKVSTFTAFGSTLQPLGILRSSLVFPHPAGCLQITIEFAVIDEKTHPVPFILGMDWMLAYGFNIMLEHGPYFTIGRNKQCYGIATKTGSSIASVSSSSHPAPLPSIGSAGPPPATGKPTTEAAEFEAAVAKIKISDELTTDERASLLALIRRFPMVFAHGTNQLGNLTNDPGCSISVDMEHLPPRIKQNTYPASPHARNAMKQCVDEFLRIGISLDANKGFHQIPMNPEHAERTAFATPFGQYEYTRMPMGLQNAPAEFQRRMDSHFHTEVCEGWISIYIDDLLVRSLSFAEHLQHLERTFLVLDRHGWTMSPDKCFFGFSQIRQLGHRVSGVLLGIDDNKVVAVKSWRAPVSRNELRTWLGFSGYFRKFIQGYSLIARLLTRLLGKDVPWQWTVPCQTAFETMKTMLLNAPVLGQPNYDLPFDLATDASVIGVGACLEPTQEIDGEKRKVVICYISHQLKPSEEKDSMPQLECLAVVWALEKLHVFLDGTHFTVWPDAQALRSLMDMHSPSRHMLRWQLAIQECRGHMHIRHRPGKANGSADGLSRFPLPNDASNPAANLSDDVAVRVQALSFAMLDDEFFSRIRRSYEADRDFARIFRALKKPEKDISQLLAGLDAATHRDFIAGRFLLLGDLLYRRKGSRTSLVVLDKETRAALLSACHDEVTSGHFALEKTYARLQPLAWWPSMYEDASAYCRSCDACQRANHHTGKPYSLAQLITEPKRPWDIINMDFVGPFQKGGAAQHDAVLVVTDRFSRRCRLLPTFLDADARQTAALFYTYVLNDVGVPLGIISDRDKLFTSKFWKPTVSLSAISARSKTPSAAFSWEDESGFTHDWTELLPGLEFAINSSKHATLGKSPFEVERGYVPRSIYNLMKSKLPTVSPDPASESFTHMLLASQTRASTCIADAADYAKQRWDDKHVEPPFEVGDEVMLSKKIGPNAIRLALTGEYARKHPVFPVSLAKPDHRTDADRFPGRRQPAPPQPDIIDGQAHWVIEQILDERRPPAKCGAKGKRGVEYLVKWEGRPDSYNRWVPVADLYNAKEALQDYLNAHRGPAHTPDADHAPAADNPTPASPVHAPPAASPHMTRARTARSS